MAAKNLTEHERIADWAWELYKARFAHAPASVYTKDEYRCDTEAQNAFDAAESFDRETDRRGALVPRDRSWA